MTVTTGEGRGHMHSLNFYRQMDRCSKSQVAAVVQRQVSGYRSCGRRRPALGGARREGVGRWSGGRRRREARQEPGAAARQEEVEAAASR